MTSGAISTLASRGTSVRDKLCESVRSRCVSTR